MNLLDKKTKTMGVIKKPLIIETMKKLEKIKFKLKFK